MKLILTEYSFNSFLLCINIIGSPVSSGFQLHVLGLLSLPNHVRQFLVINKIDRGGEIDIETDILLALFPWRTQTISGSINRLEVLISS